MLVSILLPAYDATSTLAATLATVYAQRWPDWELIIVDDASSDGTLALAQAAAAARPGQVRVLASAENGGSGRARNLALAASQGDLVASLDADDLWDADKLSHQVAMLAAHPEAQLVWGPGWFADSAGQPTRLQEVPLPPTPTLLPPPQLAALMLEGTSPFTSSLLVRRAAALVVSGYEDLRRGQDMSFLYKLAARYTALYDPRPLCFYRQHEGSSTRWCEQNLVYAQRDDLYYRWVVSFLRATPALAHLAPRAEATLANHQQAVAAERALADLRERQPSES